MLETHIYAQKTRRVHVLELVVAHPEVHKAHELRSPSALKASYLYSICRFSATGFSYFQGLLIAAICAAAICVGALTSGTWIWGHYGALTKRTRDLAW